MTEDYIQAMVGLGLTEDEAENMLEDMGINDEYDEDENIEEDLNTKS